MAELRVLEPQGDCKADAVALLKEWLTRAEAGEVISVAVVADLKGGGIEVDSSKHESLCERLGRLRLLEQQLIDGARR